ncbi:MAG: hypothetical protein CL878_06155 [Dehalococcoidia bacterium]|nr:hypothetical protein [Dehalococcoidia bacterium]
MEYRTFGATGLQVSAIGLGAFPLSGMQAQSDGQLRGWTGTDDREAVALIHRGEELGVNLIDTAESYGSGHSEIITGKALSGRRERWVVATKVSPFTKTRPNVGSEGSPLTASTARQRIMEACEGSLRRLKMDYIDLYQLHAIPAEPTMPAVMEALSTLRQQGKVRWYGISTNDHAAVEQLRALGPIDVLQIGYNLLEREADALLHWCREEQIGTLIRVPLAKGMLTGKYVGANAAVVPDNDVRYDRFRKPESVEALQKLPQLNYLAEGTGRMMPQAALRFVLDHPGVSCVIAGAKNPQQIEGNAASVDVPPLSEAELQQALEIADTIRTPGWT